VDGSGVMGVVLVLLAAAVAVTAVDFLIPLLM
jgi:hypothetical protein